MNIFYLHYNPIAAASWMVDSHVVKMVLESCQMLSTAHRVLDGKKIKYERYVDGSVPARFRKVTEYVMDDHLTNINLYKATHVNHSSTVWCRSSAENYQWLYDHLQALLNEYSHRFGKIHKCERLTPFLKDLPHNISNGPFTQPPCAMPPEYIISTDAVENYRNYYKYGKTKLHKYTRSTPPAWLTD